MKSIFLLTLLCFISFSSTVTGQTVTGHILDDKQFPVEYANVLLLSAVDSSLIKGQITDVDGGFSFEDVKTGEYYINATFVGYGEVKGEIFKVVNTDVELGALQLENGIHIGEVAIVAKKPFIELSADKMIVNVDNSALSAGNSALEVLGKSPGVTIDNNGGIALRGKEGVLVMINGKQQYLSGDALTRFLDNMPASNIKKLEIITNPSAKYEAEGNSGVINIVLKKNEKLGANGSLSSTIRQGRATSYFLNGNLNYRTEKMNLYGTAEFYDWGRRKDMLLKREIPFEEKETIFNQDVNTKNGGTGSNLVLGLDYSLSPKTRLSFLVKDARDVEQELTDSKTSISGDNSELFNQLDVRTDGNANYKTQTYNGNLHHIFNEKGYELNLDADYNIYSNDRDFHYDNIFSNTKGSVELEPSFLRNDQLVDINIFATKLDVTLPIHEQFNLEIGSKFSQVNTFNSTLFESLEEGKWVNQLNRSNDFRYTENVLAFYVNSSTKVKEFSIQAGLRAENTYSVGESITLEKPVERQYLDFFPSISISKTFNEKHNFSVSYSRRLERPNYRDLNPFEFFLDQYTFSRGNPFLNPQYASSVGLNYGYSSSFFVSVDYTKTKNIIFEVLEQNNEDNTTFQTIQNLDDSESFSVTLSKPVIWNEWFVSRVNYTTYYSSFSSRIPSGNFVNRNVAHFINAGNEVTLPNGWNLEVGMNYQSKVVWGLFDVAPRGSVDVGISKKLFNDRASLKVSVDDLFDTKNSRVSIMQNDLDVVVDQFQDNRRVKATFSYNFGNKKVKAAKKRKTASSAEGERL